MPADRDFSIQMGKDGLNFRDQPTAVQLTELVDGMNWRLDERGALVKRLGFDFYKTGGGAVNQTSSPITELFCYRKSGSTPVIVAATDNGHVQTSPEDGVWTDIRTGLTAGIRYNFAQLNDVLYTNNATDGLQKWDGTTWTAIGAGPKGTMMTVWRNRLWVAGDAAHPRRVYWSAILDPTTWPALNFVDVPLVADELITGLTTAPNIGQGFDGSDGVLVFSRRSTHRITDDFDNTGGVVIGGANVLVDGGQGCFAHRTIRQVAGRVYLLGRDGIYSTDGHTQLRLESARIGTGFFTDRLALASASTSVGIAWGGNYLVAMPGAGASGNTVVLELYLTLPDNAGHPIMAMNMPCGSFVTYPNSGGDRLYFADSSAADTRYLRRGFWTGTDADGSGTTNAITAFARSGASLFGWPRQKRMRRITVNGRGTILVGVSADLEAAVGESKTVILSQQTDVWGDEKWNTGTWGPRSGSVEKSEWFTRAGRYLTIYVQESGTTTASPRTRLGLAGNPVGGAAIYDLFARLTPLNRD